MIDKKQIYAVLLAGGGGTRLWPKSRTKTPKQFLKLTGSQTMMQIAAARINKLVDWENIIVVPIRFILKKLKNNFQKLKLKILSLSQRSVTQPLLCWSEHFMPKVKMKMQ